MTYHGFEPKPKPVRVLTLITVNFQEGIKRIFITLNKTNKPTGPGKPTHTHTNRNTETNEEATESSDTPG